MLTYLLERENYEIFTVTSAMEGIAQLEKQRYDLVISDVMMPQVSGYELTRLIRERYSISELPILLLTARTRNEDILTGFQSGANDYVKKPVDSTELKARVRALIELKLSIEERVRMEGAWLQSQIQPHFLYNTLNSIAALGEIDLPKMQALLEEFSNYLQLSFDFKNSDPMVPLEHELSLVRSYLYIEQERFRDRIKVCWEIEPNINVFLPPLSIQPLVENAVRHGILQRKEGGNYLYSNKSIF
ncbi:response regulator [Gracilibacillus sp. JCM 18860]|uniref:response regulator n=1 Tax=Gracilibacillus sp. JCM 18860 TaxID=1306159 RepID=UPI003260A931